MLDIDMLSLGQLIRINGKYGIVKKCMHNLKYYELYLNYNEVIVSGHSLLNIEGAIHVFDTVNIYGCKDCFCINC